MASGKRKFSHETRDIDFANAIIIVANRQNYSVIYETKNISPSNPQAFRIGITVASRNKFESPDLIDRQSTNSVFFKLIISTPINNPEKEEKSSPLAYTTSPIQHDEELFRKIKDKQATPCSTEINPEQFSIRTRRY